HRSATSQQLLRLERERGTAWSALRDEVETFLGDFVYGAEDGNVAPSSPVNAATPFTSNASHFAAWIAARPDENKELADLLGTLPSPPGTAWLGELVRGFLQDDLARAARIASADADRGT